MAQEVILQNEKGEEIYPVTGSQQVLRNGTSTTVEETLQTLETSVKKAQPKEEGKGLSTNDYTTEDKEKVGNALLKTEQTLTAEEQAQVKKNLGIEGGGGGSADAVLYTPQTLTDEQKTQAQSNIGVKDLVDFAGVGEKRSESFVAWKNAFRGTSGSITDNTSYKISQPVQVKFGDIIDFEMTGGAGTSVLSEVLNDDAHTFVRSIFAGGKSQYRYIADKDMYVEFSGAAASFVKAYSIQSASIANNLPAYKTPDGGYNRALFEAAGAVYDEEKHCWLLNELELTDAEMANCVAANLRAPLADKGTGYYAVQKNIRTNLPNNAISGYTYTIKMYCFFFQCTALEISNVSASDKIIQVSDMSFAYNLCPVLRKELSILDVSQCNSFANIIKSSPNVESIRLKGLKKDLDYSPSPKINYECLKYIVDNAANTEAITITVHATTYGYLTGTIEPTEQVGGTKEEWMQLVTDASEKQCSFASA